jgi:hypothetical protein
MTPRGGEDKGPGVSQETAEPRAPTWRRPLEALLQLPPILATLPLVLLIWRSFRARVDYPFDIEWMEGGMLVHVWRLREGLGIYVEPSADWVPYLYPPLYPWLLSLVGEPSYANARALSFLGTLAAAAAAVLAVRLEKVGIGFALAAAGLFFSAYDDTGSFFDLVRNDALAIGLGAWAMTLCRQGSRPAAAAGGLLLFAAFTAKHNLAAVGLPILLWLWRYRGRRTALIFAAASVIPALTFVGVMQLATDGLFLTYLLGVPGAHPLVGERGFPRAQTELWDYAPWINAAAMLAGLAMLRAGDRRGRIALGLGAACAAALMVAGTMGWLPSNGKELSVAGKVIAGVALGVSLLSLGWVFWRRHHSEGARYWVGIAMVIVPLVALMRAHHGGFVNVSIPGFWLMAVMACGLAGTAARRHPALAALLAGLLTWQLWDARWDDPERYLPTEADREAGEQVVAQIAAYEGEVLAPHFPWLPAMAGKAPSLPLIAYWDIDHKGGPLKQYGKVVDEAMAARRWDAALMPSKPMQHGLQRYYTRGEKVGLRGSALRTKVGWRVQPMYFWEPKPVGRKPPPDTRQGEEDSAEDSAEDPAEQRED